MGSKTAESLGNIEYAIFDMDGLLSACQIQTSNFMNFIAEPPQCEFSNN